MKSMNQSGKIKWAIGIWMAILFVGLGAYMTVNGAPSGTVAVVNTYGQETPGAGGQGVVTPVIVAFAAPNANTLTFTPTFTMTSTQTYTPTQTYTNTPTGSNTPAAGTNTLTLTNTLTPTFTYTPTFTLTSTSTYTPSLTPVNTPIPPTPIINVADYQVAVAGGSTAVTIIPPFDFTSLVVNFTSGTGVTVVPAFISGAVTTVGTSPLLFADVMGNVNISPIATTGNSYVTRIIGMQGVVLQPNGAVSLVAKFTYAHSGLGEANNINNIAKNYYPTLTPTFTGTLTPTNTPTPIGAYSTTFDCLSGGATIFTSRAFTNFGVQITFSNKNSAASTIALSAGVGPSVSGTNSANFILAINQTNEFFGSVPSGNSSAVGPGNYIKCVPLITPTQTISITMAFQFIYGPLVYKGVSEGQVYAWYKVDNKTGEKRMIEVENRGTWVNAFDWFHWKCG